MLIGSSARCRSDFFSKRRNYNMAIEHARLCLDIVTDDHMREHPARSALFLFATLYDFLTELQISNIKWKHVDLEEGTVRINDRLTLILPDLIHELLEDTVRVAGKGNGRVFPRTGQNVTLVEEIREFRTQFAEYASENLLASGMRSQKPA